MPPVNSSDFLLLMDGAAPASTGFQNIVLFAAALGIGYFMFIRPAQKERKQTDDLHASLAKDDRVITTSGMHGRVVEVRDTSVVLELGDSFRVEFEKSAISSRNDATTA